MLPMKQVELYGNEPKKTWLEQNQELKWERWSKGLCGFCGKEIKPPFGPFGCGDCLKEYDIKGWSRRLARHHKGKAEICEECGSTSNVDWHHLDYSKPLKVIPLCKTCHGMRGRYQKPYFYPVTPIASKTYDPRQYQPLFFR